jgi:hypothetical protein
MPGGRIIKGRTPQKRKRMEKQAAGPKPKYKITSKRRAELDKSLINKNQGLGLPLKEKYGQTNAAAIIRNTNFLSGKSAQQIIKEVEKVGGVKKWLALKNKTIRERAKFNKSAWKDLGF